MKGLIFVAIGFTIGVGIVGIIDILKQINRIKDEEGYR